MYLEALYQVYAPLPVTFFYMLWIQVSSFKSRLAWACRLRTGTFIVVSKYYQPRDVEHVAYKE